MMEFITKVYEPEVGNLVIAKVGISLGAGVFLVSKMILDTAAFGYASATLSLWQPYGKRSTCVLCERIGIN